MKGEKRKVNPASAGNQAEIKQKANDMLAFLRRLSGNIAELEVSANIEMEVIATKYKAQLEPLKEEKMTLEKGLVSLMKMGKSILFADTDVVNLSQGSLIHNSGEKVHIPKNALIACKENKFTDVIKIAESLDRDAIEKWPDAKLVLIGAERKPSEEFKYSLRAKD